MTRVCVLVNAARLGERLSRLWGRRPSDREIREWLNSQGLTNHGGSKWYCNGPKVDCLLPDEIIAEMHLETDDGVTMVREPADAEQRAPSHDLEP